MKKFALAAAVALLLPAPLMAAPDAFLGVYMTEDRDKDGGALVEEVAPNSPAAEAGLRKGDLVVECNGTATPTSKAFVNLLLEASAGQTLQLSVERDGWRKAVSVTLGGRPSATRPEATPPVRRPQRVPRNSGFLGVYLRQGENGEAIIDGVQPGSAAERANLQSGDIVRKVAGAVVTEPTGMVEALGAFGPGQAVKIEIDRGGRTLVVEATLGQRTNAQRPQERPAQPAPRPAQPTPSAKKAPYMGIALEDKDGKGPLTVEDVAANSPAEKFGVRTGDVVVSVGDDKVSTIEQFVAAMNGKFAGDVVVLRVERDGWRSDVRVTLGERPVGE